MPEISEVKYLIKQFPGDRSVLGAQQLYHNEQGIVRSSVSGMCSMYCGRYSKYLTDIEIPCIIFHGLPKHVFLGMICKEGDRPLSLVILDPTTAQLYNSHIESDEMKQLFIGLFDEHKKALSGEMLSQSFKVSATCSKTFDAPQKEIFNKHVKEHIAKIGIDFTLLEAVTCIQRQTSR
jgi:hypothetical protein